ncbi:MAG TPA: class I SAM-dependent methyltransferase [Longimicrobiales bacterium]|nr:class I SAM-dependent methyltransferase [Longimicrobiales bacterium]
MLDVISRLAEAPPLADSRLLDVGSAHGWFLDAARGRGAQAEGIEPDPELHAFSVARGLPVTEGFFPDDLPSPGGSGGYDWIVFNDVLEHVPDPRAVLRASAERLAAGGILVVNGPSRRGFFFRMARLFHRLGYRAPLDRMWQRGLPSPHLSYFEPATLQAMARSEGLTEIHRFPLPSLSRDGLRERLAYAGSIPGPIRFVMWLALWVASPMIAILPRDIQVQVFRRTD